MSTPQTKKLNLNPEIAPPAISQVKAIDLGLPRPWRIALRVVELQVSLVFDLINQLCIGRAHVESGFYPDIDLAAFGAGEMGVSREHLYIRLDANRVVVVDNNSANGTRLNGERIEPKSPYIVRHGDALQLGLLKLQIELLSDRYA